MRPRIAGYSHSLFLPLLACAIFAGSSLPLPGAPKQLPNYAQTTPPPTAAPEGTVDQDAQVDATKRELEAMRASAIKKAAETSANKNQPSQTKEQVRASLWSPELVCKLSLGIGVFAVLLLICVTILLRQQSVPTSAEQLLRTFGIIVIIFAAVFLVIAGYSDTQITPVIGLLGTIAGYLLGRRIEPPTGPTPRTGGLPDETKP